MAVHASHAAIPPIKGARFSMAVPLFDADGDPTAQTTPDTEVSKDNAAAADAAEEVSATSGMDGMGLITFTGAETDCSILTANFKAASGPKASLATIYPQVLAIVGSGTMSAGSAGGGTLGTLLAYDVTGCFIKTTGGTGGGGAGGTSNQARRIITYNTGTGAFTVAPNWETTPSTDTTYDVLLPEGVTLGMLRTLNPTTAGRTVDVSAGGEVGLDWANVGSPTTTLNLSGTTIKTATDVETDTAEIGTAGAGLTNINLPNQTMDIVGNITGNLSGSVGSVTGAVGSVTADVGITQGGADKVWSSAARSLTSFGSLVSDIATAVWGAATRLLSAGTNIVLAKGTGVTGFNDLSDAQVNAEVDAAIETYHLDHLLAVTYDPASKPGAADALLNELVESDAGVARYTANALEQAPTGGSAPTVEDIANEVRTELTIELARIDVATSTRATPAQVATELGTYDAPTKAELDSAIATVTSAITALNNLSSAQVTTALNTYDAPTKAEMDSAVALLATAAMLTLVKAKTDPMIYGVANALNVNMTHINETALVGTGVLGDEWDAA